MKQEIEMYDKQMRQFAQSIYPYIIDYILSNEAKNDSNEVRGSNDNINTMKGE